MVIVMEQRLPSPDRIIHLKAVASDRLSTAGLFKLVREAGRYTSYMIRNELCMY